MLDWNEYIAQLISQSSSLDGISLSLGDLSKPVGIPPIIKASILMLDRMQENQGKFNILVFPERIQSIFIFTLSKLLYNIAEGRIESAYDPEKFQSGEHLKLGNAVAEFLRVEERYGKKHIVLRLADLETSAPIEYFPLFQKTTAKVLSKDAKFSEAKRAAKALLPNMSGDKKYLKLLTDHKTHMDSSIINMTTIINAKEQINNCELFGQSVKDLLLIGQADYEGNVRNVGAGQLGGTPAIVLASDLYAIAETARKGHPIQSIIIDGSNANMLLSQLDALDDLMRLGVPITCVTDIVNSFDLQPFLDRKFNLWRWDESSITEKLYDANPLSSDRKTKQCAQRKIDYIMADGNEISTAIRLLYQQRKESQTASVQVSKMFEKLFSLAFVALHETVPYTQNECTQIKSTLNDCYTTLSQEKSYIAEQSYKDYSTIINCLKTVFTQGYLLPKNQYLERHLLSTRLRRFALIVPERSNKSRIEQYWQQWCKTNGMATEVDVLYPAEYYLIPCDQYNATIVVGWLKRAIMRKVLYSFNTQNYAVLMYDYEKGWRNYATARWKAALDNSQNRKAIEKAFTTEKVQISTTRFESAAPVVEDIPKEDEYEEIETILKENKYRRYVASGGSKPASETAEAIPVNFVGGYLAFYRTGHTVLSATNIIVNDADRLREDDKKLPDQLKLGDFVVVRETDRDIIKEMADVILAREGKSELRALSGKWREALSIEALFYTPEEIYANLQKAGCTRGYPSVRSWILDEDVIAPQSKQDLEFIAKITGNGVLRDLLDQVYESAQTVRVAHVQAGRLLSELLRKRLVEALDKYGDIDPVNIWDPIELFVDGVGTVRVLKIIDIGTPVVVDVTDTNRLIDEE